jgi:hypothetical protein
MGCEPCPSKGYFHKMWRKIQLKSILLDAPAQKDGEEKQRAGGHRVLGGGEVDVKLAAAYGG